MSKTLHNPRPLPSPESLNLGQLAQVAMVFSGAILVLNIVCVMIMVFLFFVEEREAVALLSFFFVEGKR